MRAVNFQLQFVLSLPMDFDLLPLLFHQTPNAAVSFNDIHIVDSGKDPTGRVWPSELNFLYEAIDIALVGLY